MNLFIEAGAGTGKTTRLIEYILDDIERGEDVSKIVCITFTNKAAYELRSRLQEKLISIISNKQRIYLLDEDKETSLNDELLSLYKKAYDNIVLMNISTIHSFCSNILDERALDTEYGLDINYDLEGDGEYKRNYLSSLFNQFIRENYKDINYNLVLKYFNYSIPKILKYYDFEINNDANIAKLVKKHNYYYDKCLEEYRNTALNKYKEDLRKTYDKVLSLIEQDVRGTLMMNDPFSSSDIDAFTNLYMDYVKEKIIKYNDVENLETIENKKILNPLSKTISSTCISSKPLNDNFKQYLLENGKPVTTKSSLNSFNQLIMEHYSSKSNDGEIPLKDSVEEEIKSSRDKFDLSVFDYYYCINLFVEFKKYLIDNNINLSIFDNDDLIVKARDLVKQNKNAREYFKTKYNKYYIDEFQDTDIIQLELFFILNSDENATESMINDPYIKLDFNLRDDSLVFVGDPKQSIYAFRDADIKMYLKAKDYFMSHDNTKVINLPKTYRYRQDIADAIDYIFENKDNPYKLDLGVDYEKVEAKKNINSDECLSGFYQIIPQNSNKDLFEITRFNKEYISQEELLSDDEELDEKDDVNSILPCGISSLPSLINYLKQQDIFVDGNLRKIEYKDIMILTDKKRTATEIGDLLLKYNIPVNSTGVDDDVLKFDEKNNSSLISNYKTLTCIESILRLLVSNYDIYAFNTVMMTCYGYSLDEIIKLNTDKNIINDYHLIIFDKDNEVLKNNPDKYKDVLDLKHYIYHLSKYENMLSVLEDIINNPKIINNGVSKIRDDEYTLIVKAISKMHDEDIRSYSELLNSFIKNTRRLSEKNLILDSKANEIRIMNVHKAKGLESQVIIYFNDKLFKQEVSNYLCLPDNKDDSQKLYYPLLDQDMEFSSFNHSLSYNNDVIKDNTKQESKEEHARKLFVALTRAKSAIFVINEQNNQEIYKATYNKCQKVDEFRLDNVSLNNQDKYNEITNVLSLKDGLTDNLLTFTYFITPSSTKTIHSKIFKDANGDTLIKTIDFKDLSSLNLDPNIDDNDNSSILCGSEYGTIMHKVFELIVIDFSHNLINSNLKLDDFDRYLDIAIRDYLHLSPIYAFVRDIMSLKDEYKYNENIIKDAFYNNKSLCLKEMKDVFVNHYHVLEIISSTYNHRLKDILNEGDEFYPELEFDVQFLKDDNNIEIIKDMNSSKDASLIETSDFYRINGIIDLLVKNKDNTYTIYDYKTNKKDDKQVSREEFESFLKSSTYKNQLMCYTMVVQKMCDIKQEDIKTSIISVGMWE